MAGVRPAGVSVDIQGFQLDVISFGLGFFVCLAIVMMIRLAAEDR